MTYTLTSSLLSRETNKTRAVYVTTNQGRARSIAIKVALIQNNQVQKRENTKTSGKNPDQSDASEPGYVGGKRETFGLSGGDVTCNLNL